MPDLAQLFTAPRDFLKMNLLYMRGQGQPAPGIYNFVFEDATGNYGAQCTRKSKHWWKSNYDIRVWYVSADAHDGQTVPVFWLPYAPNQVWRSVLRSDAPFLLTASMTGCTFGAVKYRGGEVEVCHANYQTEDGGLDEGRMSRETAWCQKRLDQGRYRETLRGKAVREIDRQASMGATVVGVNSPKKGWTFYAQQWENLDGTNFNYHELIEL
jgi:hypothetical protein